MAEQSKKRGRPVQGTPGTNHGPNASGWDQYKKTFVKCNLSDTDKTAIKVLRGTPEKIYRQFQDFVDAGFKVTIQFEPNNDCYGAYATISDQTDANYPFSLSARGPNVDSALATLLYKHYIMLDGDWTKAAKFVTDEEGFG